MDVKIFCPYCGKQMSTSNITDVGGHIYSVARTVSGRFLIEQSCDIDFYCANCNVTFTVKKKRYANINDIFKE